MSYMRLISRNPWPCIHMPKWAVFSEAQRTTCIFPWFYEKIGTPNCILVTFEYKLSLVLSLEYSPTHHISFPTPTHIHQLLIISIHHQNIIMWQNFLKGYKSLYWMQLYNALAKTVLLITRATHGILNWLTQLSIYPIRFGPIESLTSMEHLVLSLNLNFGKGSFPRFRTFVNVLQTFTPNFNPYHQSHCTPAFDAAPQIYNVGYPVLTIKSKSQKYFFSQLWIANCLSLRL